ncbi:MAG: alpha/beta fold hydrolase [Acidimicrobiales bacterium]
MAHDLTRRFAVNGVELAWDRWGDQTPAMPLLLCHGFSGSAHDFALQIDALAADRPVIALDHRGHGRSTKTHDATTYTIDQIVADLVALVDAEVPGPIDLLGHSMGGAVALRVTLARPDLARSLILMDTSAWSFRSVDPKVSDMLTSFFATFDPADGLPDITGLKSDEDELIAERTPASWQARKDELAAAFDPYALQALGEQLFAGDVSVRDRLGEIACPVTVIAGANDRPFVDQADALAAEVADGRSAIIDGAYHSPQLTHPDEWRGAVLAHLARAELVTR